MGHTSCQKTIDDDRPVVLENASKENVSDDPASERYNLRCYIRARIIVDGEVYGTVCFADEHPQDGLEGDVTQSTVKVLAQWIGYEIEHHQYEAELEDREERLQTLFEHAPDGIVIHDEEGNVIDANETLLENLGYDHDEMLSMNVADFEVGFDEEFLLEGWTGMSEDRPLKVEGTHRRKDDLTYPVEVWVSRNRHSEGDRFVAICRDVTDRRERERKLERHREFVESATDMITLIDSDGTIKYVSPAIERVLGWDPEELIGENGFEYVHPDDRDERTDDIEALVEGSEGEAVLEFRFECADGSYCWIEATARDLLDDPDIDGLLLSSRNVTERKEHERQISALHDATRDLIDAESKIEVADIAVEAASDLLDFSLPSVWFPEDDELSLVANSDDHQRLLEETGTPDPSHPRGSWVWDVFEDGDTVVRSPMSREELAADVPLQSSIVLPIGSHGIFACAATGAVDFTDRQVRVAETLARNVRVALDQLEQRNALERQKEFVDDLLDAIEDVVYVLDTAGDLQMWNAAFEEVTGYESDEVASMNATEFFAGDDVEAAAAAVEGAFESGRTRVELDFRTRDGEAIPYEFIANVFEAPDGEPVMAGSGRDRSLHVEYEQRLEEQRDRLDLLNQVVRHDVRNDMQVVHGRAQILEDHIDDDGQEHLREVIHATEEAIELTKTARDLTETMLREEEDLKPISLDRECSSQIVEIRSQHDRAVIRTDGRLPTVDVQADEMLEAVFRNLLQNAIVHNDKGVPEVTVSADVHDETVHVNIADNGPGIPDNQKEEVFGKGEKGLDSPGTGLGLYLVKTLVENYGGEVWIEDNDPEGAVFVVTLPVAE
nr:PAS domain S-box protein [Natrialba swarupiae]